jgi:MarR-like DNA-binding transcriptional regulator SgrR of sgrS sRNA
VELSQIAKEIYESGKRLENGSKQLFTLSKEMAESEREYRRALQIEILQLRDQKVQATLIPDIARGKTSELKFKRDLAEARYKSARDSLEAIQSQMNGLQSILKIYQEV